MIYLKLGSKALTFYDPLSKVNITGNQVIAMKFEPKSKKLISALKGGHVERASQEDYESWLIASGQKEVENNTSQQPTAEVVREVDNELKGMLDDMSVKKLIAWAEDYGFDEDDIKSLKALSTKDEKIAFILKVKDDYS